MGCLTKASACKRLSRYFDSQCLPKNKCRRPIKGLFLFHFPDAEFFYGMFVLTDGFAVWQILKAVSGKYSRQQILKAAFFKARRLANTAVGFDFHSYLLLPYCELMFPLNPTSKKNYSSSLALPEDQAIPHSPLHAVQKCTFTTCLHSMIATMI